jgi:hypothetical protein
MWVQHPALGPPLVAPGCRIETSAARFQADAGGSGAWPVVDGVDLSLVPPEGEVAVELSWPLERFPARAAGSPLVSLDGGETCEAWTELSVTG